MRKIIKNAQVINDNWQFVNDRTQLSQLDDSCEGVFICYKLLQEADVELPDNKALGLILNSDIDTNALAAKLDNISAIALNFENFMDGRSFTQARILRENLGFKGEIRAVGDFIRDQLFYLQRCGVNAFQFVDTDPDPALSSLNDFTEYYQAAADQPLPLFRRR